MSQDVLAELKTLANIIQSSVDNIEAVVNANAFVFPSSNAPFSLESEAPRMHPSIQSAGSLITSAAAQLMTLVRPAPLVVLDVVMQVNRIVPATISHFTNHYVCDQVPRFNCDPYRSEYARSGDPPRCGPQGSIRYFVD